MVATNKAVKKISGTGRREDDNSTYDPIQHCPVPWIECRCPGVPSPTLPYRNSMAKQDGGYKMQCTNSKCQLAQKLCHSECFEQLERMLLKIIGNNGSARGWTETQKRNNLWVKKGLMLVQKQLNCRCGLGRITLDIDFYKKSENDPITETSESVQEVNKENLNMNMNKQKKRRPAKPNKPSLKFSILETPLHILRKEEKDRKAELRRLRKRRNTTQSTTSEFEIHDRPTGFKWSLCSYNNNYIDSPQSLSDGSGNTTSQLSIDGNHNFNDDTETRFKFPPNGTVCSNSSLSSQWPSPFESVALRNVDRSTDGVSKMSLGGSTVRTHTDTRSYTLFGGNSSGFMLGEKLLANLYLPFKSNQDLVDWRQALRVF